MPGVTVSKQVFAAMRAFTPQEPTASHAPPQDKTQALEPQSFFWSEDLPTFSDFCALGMTGGCVGDGCGFLEGQRVECRSCLLGWSTGVVTCASPLKVRPDNWTEARHAGGYRWDDVRVIQEVKDKEIVLVETPEEPALGELIAEPKKRKAALQPKHMVCLGGLFAQGSASSAVALGIAMMV